MSFWAQQRKAFQEIFTKISTSLRYITPFIIILAIIATDIKETIDIKRNHDPEMIEITYARILALITTNILFLFITFLWCIAFWE